MRFTDELEAELLLKKKELSSLGEETANLLSEVPQQQNYVYCISCVEYSDPVL